MDTRATNASVPVRPMPPNHRRIIMNCKVLSLVSGALPAFLTLTSFAVGLAAQQHEVSPAEGPKVGATDAPKTGAGIEPSVRPGVLPGNPWFPVVERDLGTRFSHESATGHFEFKNPKSTAVTWKHMSGSCQCSRAIIRIGDRRYELNKGANGNALTRVIEKEGGTESELVTQIEIGPGESGEVEVHIELNGVQGPRQATLDIHTTDPDTPMIKLKWQAVGAQLFVISPNEVHLNEMVWNERREFTVTVTSPVAKDFNITRMDDAGKDFTVDYRKELTDGVARWTIAGAYSPSSGDTLGGGVLKFYTDLENEPSFLVRVAAVVKGPLEIKPGTFLSLGMVRQGKAKTEKIVFQSNDGTALDAEEISFERLSVDAKFVVAKKTQEGNNLVIELEISGDAPKGLLRGDMVVQLNHPAIKRKKILFNGYIR